MANKKKPENGEDLIRQYLKDKAAGRSTFDEKSDFQKRVRSGENFGKPYDFGQSEKQKPSVPKKPDTVTKSSVSNKKMPITDNKRRDLGITQNEQREEQQRAQRKAETDALASKKEERDSLKKEADNYYKEAAKKSSEAGFQHVGIKYTGVNHNKVKQLNDEAKALRDEGDKKQEEYKAKDWEYRNANLAEQQKQVRNQIAAYGNYSANINKKESDPKYRAVNGIISGSKIVGGGNASNVTSNAQIYKDMTDAERNTYNFLYEKQGKDVANNYLKILEYDLANRYVNRRTADAQAFVGNGKGAANTANSIFGSLASIYEPAVADTTGYLSLTAKKGLQALGLDDDLPINYQKDYSSGAWGNALRGQVSQNIENDGKDLFTVGDYTFNTGKAGSFLYNNAMSIYENVVRNSAAPVLGAGGTAFLMGSQVAGSAAKDALDRGATEDQAIAYGALNGVGETLFEKISLEHLLKIKDPKTAIGRIGNILKQSGVEASEEAATSVWNMLVSSQALGELSDYNLAKEEYVRQGLSEKEAEKRASLDGWMGVLKDAFAGALSGGVTSGVQMFKNNRQMRRANSQIFAKDGAMTGVLADLIEYDGSLRGEAINSETAKTMAEAMGKHFRGETMSIAEEKLLRNSQTAREVYETVSGMDYESGAYKDLASPAESVSSEVGNVQAETQTQQEAPAQTEQKAPKKKPSKKEVKHEEMLDQLDVRAAEKKAAQEAAARQEAETPAQPKQKAPQQAQKPAEVKSEAETKAPQKAPQQGTARKADRDTVKRAYKDFSNTSMKQSRFEALYNEAYNAESFEAFMKKHPSFGEKLKGAMQKAFENGHRAEIKAENSALLNDGLIMDEGDRYMLKSRKDIDSLIERYKKAAEDGVVPIETDSENYYDQFRELSAEESQKYSEAAAKLEKYRDEHFAADKKSVSTEKKPANTEEKTASTESSTDKKKKRIESVIRNLEMLKQKLENGDMAKLEQKNPDKYSEIMFKFEQQTTDKNGSDYLGSAEDVSVLIDKYKTDLEMLEAENGAQSENIRAQKSSVDNSQKFGYNRNSQYATVAPYYNTEVTSENKQQVKEAVNKVFTDNAKNTAKILGIKLKGETSNMGGFTFSEGEAAGQQVHEISYSFEFEDATPEQAQLFASLMAENGYEQQEAAIQKRYVENIDDGNAYEYTIRYRNMDEFAVAKALEKAGITDYTIDTTNGIIQILEFDIEKNTEIRNSIDTLLNNEEGSFYGTNYNPIQSEYLDETSRAGLYRSWLEKGEQDGERRNYISEALRKVEERIAENERVKTENKAKVDAESSGFFNAQISENAAKTNEYSPEYQNGAEHPETVGAMESNPMNITRAANESKVQPEKASTKNPFNDYDRYQSETKLTKADRNALERVVKNPVKGERTVWQETVDSVIDGDTYFEKDGNYYVKNQEGKTHRVAQSVFLFAEYLGKKGVRYTLNQTAEVPKEIGGRSVSKSVATALASRIGTNEFVEKIAANMEARDNRNAGLTYFKKKHSEVINWAKNYIEANGAEKAYAEFERAADGKTKYDAEHNVLGLMMCEMLADINTSEANDLSTRIYAMIAANQTNAGQVSESMKMLKTLDRTNFTAFYEQLTQTLNQKHEKQLDGKKIILDDKLLKNAKESVGTENEARATLDLNRDIANQIPASGWDKINAVRYFCMLSSPITAIKNFFSNAVQLAMVKQKNVWLYLFERGFKKKHGDYVLTTSLTKDKEVSKYAGTVFNSAKNSETKYKEGSFAEINRTNTMRSLPGKLNKFSKYNLPGWMLDKVFSVPTTILNKTDIFFEKQLFKDRFSQVAKANNWSAEFLSDKASAKAVQAYTQAAAVSMEEALKGTYNNESSIANFINKWKSMPTNTFSEKAKKYAVGLLVETMAPFKKVPVNIAASAFNYSPAGLVFALSDLKSASKGDVDARSVLERCAKGMTGTTITIGGAILSMLGLLTIGRDSDEDKPDDEKKDNTMYLKIQDEENGDLYISIDWIDSISMQLRSGIGLKELFENTVENVKSDMNATEIIANFLSDVFSFTSKGIDSFMEQGMLQTLQNLIFNKSYANDMFDVLGNSAEKFATQFIPRVVVNARESADKEKRSTYYNDKTSNYPKWVQHIINQYIAAYGDREKLPARFDEWGNSLGEENDTKRFIESFISPAKWYRENDDEVQKMLDQLDTQVDTNVFPSSYPTEITIDGEKIALSGKEYEEVARKIGKERYKLLDELRKDREFQKLSPNEKAELIQDCYNIANEMAKYGFDDDYSISRITQDVKDAKKEKLSIPKYLRAKQAYDNMSEYEKDGVKISRSYQLADYLMNDTSTTVEEDIKIIELIERKKDKGKYKSPFENIRKVPNTSDEEMLSLYVAFRDQADKEEDLQSYMLEYGYNAEQALARYNVAKGSKVTYDALGPTQKKKADKLLAATNKGKTANEWNEEKIALAASAVTSIGDYGTKKTLKSYIAMLMAVGFTESEAKEFYKYYA